MEQRQRQHNIQDSRQHRALIVVDVQNDFCDTPNECGSLPVHGSFSMIPTLCKMIDPANYSVIVCTRDWHPHDHVSFGGQEECPSIGIWPVHCVQDSRGAAIHELVTDHLKRIEPRMESYNTRLFFLDKGHDRGVEQYSAFSNPTFISETNQERVLSNLHQILSDLHIKEIDCVGLAYDYCVGLTAIDAQLLGYQTQVLAAATRAVSLESKWEMDASLYNAGVRVVTDHMFPKKQEHQKRI